MKGKIIKLEFKWAPNNRTKGVGEQSLNLEDFWWENQVIWNQDGEDMIYQRINQERLCGI